MRQLTGSPHTSPQLSAPFPIDHVVVVDEQVRQSDALEEGNKAERDSFKHILKFSFSYICTFSVGRREVGLYLSLCDHPADPRRHQRRDESLRGILYSFLGFAIQKMPQNCLRAMWNIRKRRKGFTARK